MLEAFGLGMLAQSSLLLAGLFVCWVTVPTRVVGILAGFGAGAMISAVAFDLVPEAQDHIQLWETVLWMLVGVGVFLLGDWVVEKKFGTSGVGGAMGIVVGSVVDGVPESLIFGIQLGTGTTISVAFLAAVLVSNIPQAIAPSAELAADGWNARKLGTAVGRGRAGLRCGRRPGVPVHRRRARCPRRPGRRAGRRRAPRHADELPDPLRLRAREGAARASRPSSGSA